MQKSHRAYLVVAVVALLAISCSSLKVSQDYDMSVDFSQYRSYDLYPEPQPKTGDVRIDNPLMDARIRQAIDDTLNKMDFNRVSGQKPDFLVNYYLTIRTKLESSVYTTGAGYHAYQHPFWGGVHYQTTFREFDQGMLTIDIIDAESNRLIWRGIGTRRVREHQDPERTTAVVNETVARILAQFPPMQK